MKEATLLFLWAEDHLGSIRAEHLPGVANQEADWFSRQNIIEGDRSLHPPSVRTDCEMLQQTRD